jgi:hypothetical protein
MWQWENDDVGARRGPASGGGLQNVESWKTQTRAQKAPNTTRKKKGKPKKLLQLGKKVVKGNLVRARSLGKSLDPRGGETAVQEGGWGKGKGKGRAPRLGHQVNN